MFIIKQSDTFFWPVTVELPVDGGKFQKHTFEAEFKRVTAEKLKDIQKQLVDLDEAALVPIFKSIMVGWKGVQDQHGEAVVFCDTVFEQLLEFPQVQNGLMAAFIDANTGQAARRKN